MDGYIKVGKYLGYPSCCVEDFCYRVEKGIHIQPRKCYRSGYVPCIKCNENKTTEELIKTININRIHEIPFPDDNLDIEKEWSKINDL